MREPLALLKFKRRSATAAAFNTNITPPFNIGRQDDNAGDIRGLLHRSGSFDGTLGPSQRWSSALVLANERCGGMQIIEDLIDHSYHELHDNRSMISLIRDPQQSTFERGTEKPVQPFRSGFIGWTPAALLQFAQDHFVAKDSGTTNIGRTFFAILDQRAVDGEGEGSDERTALLVQFYDNELETVRAPFSHASQLLLRMAPQEFTIREARGLELVDSHDIYRLG